MKKILIIATIIVLVSLFSVKAYGAECKLYSPYFACQEKQQVIQLYINRFNHLGIPEGCTRGILMIDRIEVLEVDDYFLIVKGRVLPNKINEINDGYVNKIVWISKMYLKCD